MIYDLDDPRTLESTDPSCQILVWKGDPITGWGSSTRPGADLKDKLRLEIGDKNLRDHLIRVYRRRGDFIEEKTVTVIEENTSEEIKGLAEIDQKIRGNQQQKDNSPKKRKKREKTFLYVDRLNIYLAYEHWQKSFYTEMRRQQGRQIVWRCNRRQIFKESERYQDHFGGIRFRELPCNMPCQADPNNPNEDCRAGCKRYGDLFFYLWEFDDFNSFPLCRLRTKAYCDVSTIPRALKTIYETYGSVRTFSEDMGQFKMNIPFTLSRTEVPIDRPITQKQTIQGKTVWVRTGKKTEDSAWGLSLAIKPEWTEMVNARKEMKLVRSIGGTPSRRILTSAYSDAIDVEYRPVYSLPPSTPPDTSTPVCFADIVAAASNDDFYLEEQDDWQPSETDLDELRTAFARNKWRRAEILQLLKKHGKEPKDMSYLSREEFEIILDTANNKHVLNDGKNNNSETNSISQPQATSKS